MTSSDSGRVLESLWVVRLGKVEVEDTREMMVMLKGGTAAWRPARIDRPKGPLA